MHNLWSSASRSDGASARLGETAPSARERPFGKPFWLWLFGLLALAAVILVVGRIGELRRFAELAREAEPRWLAAAFGLQVLTYLCASSVWHAALARAGARRSLRSLVPLGVAKLFTDQALPSGGISGTLLVMRGLARRGVPTPIAMGALLVGLVSFYIAYGVAALGGLAVLQIYDAIGPVVMAVAAVFALFVVGVPVIVLSLRRVPSGSWLRRLRHAPHVTALLDAVAAAPSDLLRDPLLMAKTTILQLAIFLLDAATLGVMLRALGQSVPPVYVFGSFMVADVVATIGPIPLGLGIFEGASVAMLSMTGVSIEAALAGTLLLRGFTFWLPMLPGLWLAHRELRGAPVP
ncbi:MAG TPA: lysylphosphatidylglycerol synthase transmembrane domain-containing protein [Stellaceae bacterium]|nr:lysylphosphatidylglycerol synthase transmembrane domain-containing protein [Stellaceae bacterium]